MPFGGEEKGVASEGGERGVPSKRGVQSEGCVFMYNIIMYEWMHMYRCVCVYVCAAQ